MAPAAFRSGGHCRREHGCCFARQFACRRVGRSANPDSLWLNEECLLVAVGKCGGGRCATPASSGSVASEEVSAFEALCVLKGGLVALRRFDDGFT
jgi:hypothetical protein